MPSRYARSRLSFGPTVSVRRGMCVGLPRDPSRTRVGGLHSVHTPARCHQRPRNASSTVVGIPGSEHAPLRFSPTPNSVWFRSRRIHTVRRRFMEETTSMAAYNIGGQPPSSRCTRRSSAYRIRELFPKRRICRMLHISEYAHRRPSYFRFAFYGLRNSSDT